MRNFFISLVIILSILFTYSDVRYHQFLNFDDNDYITENNHVQNGLTLKNIAWAFGFPGIGYWHPLSWISHMLDCHLFGLAPGPHHMINLALHILNAIFLFLILYRMTGARYKSAIVSLLFAIHPLNVESIAWVTERKTVLSMFFFMATIYSYIRYTEKKDAKYYYFSLFLFGLGLMCKPSIIILPFLLLLLDYWPLKRLDSAELRYSFDYYLNKASRYTLSMLITLWKSQIAVLFREKIPFIILSLISSHISMLSMSKFNLVINHDQVAMNLRIYNLFVSVLKYLWHVVWPLELSIFHPFPKSIPTSFFLMALLCIVAITALILLLRKSSPWLVTGWFWFLLSLAPASGLIQAGLWPEMANRFMYIPIIGPFIMLVWEFDTRIRGNYAHTLKAILCCAMLIYFIAVTKVQNLYFSNSYALFKRAVAVTENNFVAYTSLGSALLELNRVDEAAGYLFKALALNPRYDIALVNYGVCLTKNGDHTNAALYYTRAIAINPRNTIAYINLGSIQIIQGHSVEAKRNLSKALELDPENGDAHRILGNILMGEDKIDEAIRHFRIEVEKRPSKLEARSNLSQAYEKAGRHDEALAQYESLIKMKQADKGVIYYLMAGLKSQQGRFDECKNYLESSLKHGFDVLTTLKSDKRFIKFRRTESYTQLLENQTLKVK